MVVFLRAEASLSASEIERNIVGELANVVTWTEFYTDFVAWPVLYTDLPSRIWPPRHRNARKVNKDMSDSSDGSSSFHNCH